MNYTILLLLLNTPCFVASLTLVVGATGGTGLRAIRGLLDSGSTPSDIVVLTRNKNKPLANDLRNAGFKVVQGDLDDVDSLDTSVFDGCTGCYIHSTAADTKKIDQGEAPRAAKLAKAIVEKSKKIKAVAYNSAVGEKGHGVFRVQQKHDAESAFIEVLSPNGIAFEALRANLFMEEFWKKISGRPKILAGKFSFSLPKDRRIYLTVRSVLASAEYMILRPNQGYLTERKGYGRARRSLPSIQTSGWYSNF